MKLASTDFYLEHKIHSNHGGLVEGDSLLCQGSLTRGWGAKGFSAPGDLSHVAGSACFPLMGFTSRAELQEQTASTWIHLALG